VGIRGTMLDENDRLYYEISPTSVNDAPTAGSTRERQGWITRDGKTYVPVGNIQEYKIYTQPIPE